MPPPHKIRILGPKMAKFGPKYAFLVILGQILVLLPPEKNRIFCPKRPFLLQNMLFWALGLAGLFGALLVVWLVVVARRPISQDTYLLYDIKK